MRIVGKDFWPINCWIKEKVAVIMAARKMLVARTKDYFRELTLRGDQSRKNAENPDHPPQATILASRNAEIKGVGNHMFAVDD